jgi:hypothetical protein
MALVANVNRDPKTRKRPFTPDDFSPYPSKPRRRQTISVDQLAHEIMMIAEAKAKGQR